MSSRTNNCDAMFSYNVIPISSSSVDEGIDETVARVEYNIGGRCDDDNEMFKVKFVNNHIENNILVECFVEDHLDESIVVGPKSTLIKQIDTTSNSKNLLPDTKYIEFKIRKELNGSLRHSIAMMQKKWNRVVKKTLQPHQHTVDTNLKLKLIGVDSITPTYSEVCGYYKMNLCRKFED